MTNDKETKKSKFIFGRYECEIENGTVSIPWIDNKTFEMPVYYTVANTTTRKMVVVYENQLQDEQMTIIDSGECVFNEKSKWILPNSVLKVIDREECVWLGIGSMGELVTKKTTEALSEADTEQLKEIMLKLLG